MLMPSSSTGSDHETLPHSFFQTLTDTYLDVREGVQVYRSILASTGTHLDIRQGTHPNHPSNASLYSTRIKPGSDFCASRLAPLPGHPDSMQVPCQAYLDVRQGTHTYPLLSQADTYSTRIEPGSQLGSWKEAFWGSTSESDNVIRFCGCVRTV